MEKLIVLEKDLIITIYPKTASQKITQTQYDTLTKKKEGDIYSKYIYNTSTGSQEYEHYYNYLYKLLHDPKAAPTATM